MTETRQTTVAMDESWNDLIYALTVTSFIWAKPF